MTAGLVNHLRVTVQNEAFQLCDGCLDISRHVAGKADADVKELIQHNKLGRFPQHIVHEV